MNLGECQPGACSQGPQWCGDQTGGGGTRTVRESVSVSVCVSLSSPLVVPELVYMYVFIYVSRSSVLMFKSIIIYM